MHLNFNKKNMQYIHYIKVQNFKIFGKEIVVDFDDTTVLVGPNNAGKTTIIQALTLWQLGVRSFVDSKTYIDSKTKTRKKKGKLDESTGIGINRRDIEQVPNTDTRQLFHKSRIRTGRDNEQIQITVGLDYDGEINECSVFFKYFKSEVIYAYLSEALVQNMELMDHASNLQINLLYPMSGLEREETVLQEGAIRKQIGRGITAGLLRNICYNLHATNEKDWGALTRLMEQLFYIKLDVPRRLANDDLILEYNYSEKALKTDQPLDILQAGRGQLQMLLILAFVMWRKKSLILIDEPDAHLEVLRQSQVMEVLKSLTNEFGCQVIIATHSEVIMNEADTLNLLFNGSRIALADNTKKSIKSSLKEFGIEQYFKAQLTKAVLYIEGTTDKQNLTALANYLKHPLANVLIDRVFVYYTQAPDSSHGDIELQTGYYQTHKKHFSALKPLVEELSGIALFDGDNQNRQDEDANNGLIIRFWHQYEIENYFINPSSILGFVTEYLRLNDGGGTLFLAPKLSRFNAIFQQYYLLPVFDNSAVLLNLYLNGSEVEKIALYSSNSRSKKVSSLLEKVFEVFSSEEKDRAILRKGEFYKLVPFCSEIDPEVSTKLDEIFSTLKGRDIAPEVSK
jgi:ABC-type cobalamin/Fe3+-siderophores transport system ATPase subunit